jgi:hypothetical protein
MRGVQGKHLTQVPLTKDQHPVDDLGPHRQHEAFGSLMSVVPVERLRANALTAS